MSVTVTAPVQDASSARGVSLELSGLHRSFGSAHALAGFDLSLEPGELVAMLGPSGCGKTTALRIVAGFDQPDQGSVSLNGADLTRLPANKRDMGMVFQSYSLFPHLTAGQNVGYGPRLRKVSAGERAKQAAELLELVGMGGMDGRYPHQLSGGQQQRVAVALALAGQPQLLVLDEPTTGLDVVTQAGVLALFNALREELGIALVMVSHDLGAVSAVCERIAVMYAGRVVETGRTRAAFELPAHPYTRGLLSSVARIGAPGLPTGMPGTVADALELSGCAFAPRCEFAQEVCTTGDAPELAPVEDGAETKNHRFSACLRQSEVLAAPAWEARLRPPRARELGEPLLEIKGLTVDYRRRPDARSGPTVHDVDLIVRRGEVVALVGESGSGKSTIAWTIAGLRRPTSGEIALLDQDTEPADLTKSAGRRDPVARRKVQLVFQNATTSLNPRRTVGDAVLRALRLRGLRGAKAVAERDRVFEDVGLEPGHAGRFPAQLSGGQQQRVGIARALASSPTLVLADEVVSALDVSLQASVLRLLDDLRDEHRLGYLFISHDLAVVRALADRVVVLYLGRVCEEGPIERIFGGPNHPYTRLLMDSALATEPGVHEVPAGSDDEPESAPPAAGCPFRNRCAHRVEEVCEKETPPWQELGDGHRIRCHVPVEIGAPA